MDHRPATELSQYLTFYLGGEEYAVGILRVKEILAYDTLTRVPDTPGFIRGVMNLRGSVVPVVDLAVRFGLGETAITKSTCVVIVEVELDGEITVVGVMADAVSQVVELADDQIEPPPALGTTIRVEYLKGLGQSGRKFVMILDVDCILSKGELEAAADAARETDEADPAPAAHAAEPHTPAEADSAS
jgi:purine-binding chemotaxis protein CheW